MTQRQRDLAVDYLERFGEAIAGPHLAEVLEVDIDELGYLLAHPVAMNRIRTWRVGAMVMWSISTGYRPGHEGIERVVQRVVNADTGLVIHDIAQAWGHHIESKELA